MTDENTRTEQPQKFEDALARLETIVEEMEAGELSLDEMIERFEEGSRLVKSCSAKLDEVERRIEKLVQREDGTPDAEAFPV